VFSREEERYIYIYIGNHDRWEITYKTTVTNHIDPLKQNLRKIENLILCNKF